jgi:uncharacterized protein (DUF362 family)
MAAERSRVVLVRAKKGPPASAAAPDATTLREMVEHGLRELADTPDVAAAWSRYFTRDDTIGIKVNCLGGPRICTSPALAEATARSLSALGIQPKHVYVWDRSARELARCGYSLNWKDPGRVQCVATDIQGVDYERDLSVFGSIGSRLSRVLTSTVSAQINMPILKDHGICGITGALKNMFGAIHNPNKYHEDRCDPFIADVNALPQIRKKNRLVIFDALRIQYNGGPGFKPQWVEEPGWILLSEDPVAVDTVAATLLDRIRKKHGLPPIEKDGGLPAYIRTAADREHALGTARWESIDFREKTL